MAIVWVMGELRIIKGARVRLVPSTEEDGMSGIPVSSERGGTATRGALAPIMLCIDS